MECVPNKTYEHMFNFSFSLPFFYCSAHWSSYFKTQYQTNDVFDWRVCIFLYVFRFFMFLRFSNRMTVCVWHTHSHTLHSKDPHINTKNTLSPIWLRNFSHFLYMCVSIWLLLSFDIIVVVVVVTLFGSLFDISNREKKETF